MDSEDLKAVCLEAAALVERGWCRREEAVNRHGERVDPTDPSAACFSIFGAVVRAADDHFESEDEADAAARLIGRSLAVVCSKRAGTEREPFVTCFHFNELPGLGPSDAEEVLHQAAEIVGREEEIGPGPYPHQWWQRMEKP